MIRIISGNPGAGKTLLAMHFMSIDTSINGYDNYLKSCNQIKTFNDCGYAFDYPKQKHVTYFNGQARISVMGKPVKNPYSFNPWKMALPTRKNDVHLFFPCSKIYIDEAQRFYNSRLFQKFPTAVSRFFELHRQWDLDITLIAQRAGLIDLNIRELAEELIYVEDLNTEVGTLGNLIKATWRVRKFTNNADLEHYLDGHKELGQEEIIESTENLFKFYDTKFFKFLFLNQRRSQKFLQEYLRPFKYSPELVDALSEVYSFEAPSGYYDNDKKEKCIGGR